jgi:prepilin-type N-terminal cleavage/methylation domain-containing protein
MRRAFTLVEMLIAMALTLILVMAIAEFYARLGETVKDGRANIEISGQLRTVVQQLKTDLDSVTLPVVPWTEDGPGYFEYTEGRGTDTDWFGDGSALATDDAWAAQGVTTLLGDVDDVLAFTIRAKDTPFYGQRWTPTGVVVESSSYAEVIWFTGFRDSNGDGTWQPDEPRYLCRRLLILRPDLGPLQMPAGETNPFQWNDVSARFTNNQWRTNSLSHLARRENRYAHQPDPFAFPNRLLLNPHSATSLATWQLQGDRAGEDAILSNLLAFDVRAFDPEAPVYAAAATDARFTVQPGDPGYRASLGFPLVGYGAYVDLYYNRPPAMAISSWFSGPMAAKSQLHDPAGPAVYDTWAMSYERDGIDQDGSGEADQGFNGIDDDGLNGVDDIDERDTHPPYSRRLRGIEVTIRVYEPGTRQMRQATVGTDFLAE